MIIQHNHEKPIRTIKKGREYLNLYPCGCISRPQIKMIPSGNWRVTGAVEINNFGYRVKFYSLDTIIKNADIIPWNFKNGKQRVFICDIDHGTNRIWMNPSHSVF